LYDTFDPETASRLADKLEIHYTPVHGSWLNMAEIEWSVLNRQCMKDYFRTGAVSRCNRRRGKRLKAIITTSGE
jgi:hypothetical protein